MTLENMNTSIFNTFTGELEELTMYTDMHFKLYISIFIGLQIITIIMFYSNKFNIINKFKRVILNSMYSISMIFTLVFAIEAIFFTKNKYFYPIGTFMVVYLIMIGRRLKNNIKK